MTEDNKPVHISTETLGETSYEGGKAYLLRHEFLMPGDMRYVIFELRYRLRKDGSWTVRYSPVHYHKDDSKKEDYECKAYNVLLDEVSKKVQTRTTLRIERVLMGLLYSDAIANGAEHGEPPF